MTHHLPHNEHHLKPNLLERFRAFLAERGAEIMTTTNPWEVLRVRANGGTHVLYKNSAGKLTWPAELVTAYKACQINGGWRAVQPGARRRTPVLIRTLLERDGRECFYCGDEMPDGEETLEHLHSVTQGGSSHPSNCALAHADCNQKADHLPIVEKVKLREAMRAARRTAIIPVAALSEAA